MLLWLDCVKYQPWVSSNPADTPNDKKQTSLPVVAATGLPRRDWYTPKDPTAAPKIAIPRDQSKAVEQSTQVWLLIAAFSSTKKAVPPTMATSSITVRSFTPHEPTTPAVRVVNTHLPKSGRNTRGAVRTRRYDGPRLGE